MLRYGEAYTNVFLHPQYARVSRNKEESYILRKMGTDFISFESHLYRNNYSIGPFL